MDVECAVVDGHVDVESTSDTTSSREDILLESFSLHTLFSSAEKDMCLLSSSRFVLRSAIFGAALRDHYDQQSSYLGANGSCT